MSVGTLKVKIFDAKGTSIVPVAKSTVTVGSAAHCDVVIDHASVQAEHVRAWLEGGRIWIQDLNTSGGTFLNGIRLPSLKPMLVRDLDVLKLGESPATIGMEANMVRAPIVKAAPVVEEVTQTEFRAPAAKDQELEKRRDELAKVSRELAELKLQLQMGRLEKTAGDDLRKQINQLREDLRDLSEQKEKTEFSIRRQEEDSAKRVAAAEDDITAQRRAAELEIKEMRDTAGRKLGHWKVDMVAELSKQLHVVTLAKTKAWVTRPMSQDMALEWEAELNQMFRRVLLDEQTHVLPPGEVTRTTPLIPLDQMNAKAEKERAKERERERQRQREKEAQEEFAEPPAAPPVGSNSATRKMRVVRPPKIRLNVNKASLFAAGAFVVLILTLFMVRLMRHSPTRTVASTPSSATPAAVQPLPAPNPPAVPARFAPRQTKVFKKTYTENVLYTENYVEAEFNTAFRQRWMADLVKTGRDEWHLDDKTIATVASKEAQLIQDLQHVRDGILVGREQEGIAAMRARENGFQRDLQALLRNPSYVDRYQRLKHSFFTRNQQYLSVHPATR